MILKRHGYYKEMPYAEPSDPSIFDSIGKKNPEKDKICRYLNNGFILAACGGVTNDIINPKNGVIGTPDEMTDGQWIWPRDVAYYVQNYDLQLNPVFIDHMRSKN